MLCQPQTNQKKGAQDDVAVSDDDKRNARLRLQSLECPAAQRALGMERRLLGGQEGPELALPCPLPADGRPHVLAPHSVLAGAAADEPCGHGDIGNERLKQIS